MKLFRNKFSNERRTGFFPVLLFLVVVLLLGTSGNVFGRECVWDGGGADTNFTTAANWDGPDIAPVADDNVTFNGTSNKACVLDAFSLDQGDFTVTSAYTGSFTSSGTFICDAATLDLSGLTGAGWNISNQFETGNIDHGAWTITAGTFTTSGPLYISGNVTLSGNATISQGANTWTVMQGTAVKTISAAAGWTGSITFNKFEENSDTSATVAPNQARTHIECNINVGTWSMYTNHSNNAGDGYFVIGDGTNAVTVTVSGGYHNKGKTETLANSTVRVAGDIEFNDALAWGFDTSTGGTFEWTGTSDMHVYPNSNFAYTFYNFTLSGSATLWHQQNDIYITNNLTISDGIWHMTKSMYVTGNIALSGDAILRPLGDDAPGQIKFGGTLSCANTSKIKPEWCDVSVDPAHYVEIIGNAGALRAFTGATTSLDQSWLENGANQVRFNNVDVQFDLTSQGAGYQIALTGNSTFDAITLNGDSKTTFTTGAYTATVGGTFTNTYGTVTISASGAINAGANAFTSNTANSTVATSGALTCGDLTIGSALATGTFTNTATNTISSSGNVVITVFGATTTNNTLTLTGDGKYIDASVNLGNVVINGGTDVSKDYIKDQALTLDGTFTLNTGKFFTTNDGVADRNLTTAGTIDIDGTFTANSSTITVTGNANFDFSGGTFTLGTSTIDLQGTGNLSPTNGAWVYNLTCGAAGKTTTLTNNIVVNGTLALGTGIFTGNAGTEDVAFNNNAVVKPFIHGGGTISVDVLLFQGTGTHTLDNGTYGCTEVKFEPSGGASHWDLEGDATFSGILSIYGSSGNLAELELDGHAVICNGLLHIGYSSDLTYDGYLDIGTGSVDANAAFDITSNSDCTLEIVAGGSTNFGSTVSIGASSTISNSGTIKFDSGGAQSLDPTGHNLGNIQVSTANTNLSFTTTLACGTITVDANTTLTNVTDNANLTLGGSVSNAGTITFNAPTSDLIQIRSSVGGTQRNWQGAGTFNMTDVDAKDQSCTGGTPASITVTSGTDSGNNTNWIFGTATISGTAYTDDTEVTTINNTAVTVVVYDDSAATKSSYTTTTSAAGVYSVTNGTLADNDIICVYLNTAGVTKGTTAYRCALGVVNVSSLNIYQDHLVVFNTDTTDMTNTDLNNVDDGDTDVVYAVAGGNLTVDDGIELFLKGSVIPKTFAPGGNVAVQGTGDLQIESGAILSMAGKDLAVADDIRNAGTITQTTPGTTTPSGAVKVITGGGTTTFYNLTVTGTYTVDTTVTASNNLTLTTGTYTANANTTTVGGTLNINGGTGDFDDAAATTLDCNGSVTLSAGTLRAPTPSATATFTVAGDWTISGTGAFEPGLGTVNFNGTAAGQTVTTNAEIYNTITVSNTHAAGVIFADPFRTATFIDTTADSKLTFNAGDTYTITDAAGVNSGLYLGAGLSAGDEITLISDSAGTQFIFDVTGGAQAVSYVNVKDSAASTNSITASNSINSGGNDDGGPAPHWIFGAVTRYWVAGGNSDWDTNANWSSASGGAGGANYPAAGDTAIFDNGSDFNCTLDAAVSIAVLNVQAGYDGIISCGTNNFTTSGNMTLSSGTYTVGANTTRVDGTLTVSGGTGTFTSGTIDANGAVSITGGTLVAPSGDFNVATNWSHAGGLFTPSNGTVVFDTAADSTIANATTFYNLTCNTASKKIYVTGGTTQTINNTLTIDGQDSITKITLHSTADGTPYTLNFPNGAQTIIYVDLKDCTAGTNASIAYNSLDSLGNTGWTFLMVDPFGVVFDSVTDNPISGAVVTIYDSAGAILVPGIAGAGGCQIAAADANPQTVGATGAYAFLCANAVGYTIAVTAPGYTYPSTVTNLPAGRVIVTGSRGQAFTVAGAIIQMDHPMDGTDMLLKIKKTANKKEAVIGDIVTYTVTIKNISATPVTGIYLADQIPAGFKYIKGKAILDNVPLEPSGSRPIMFNIGTIAAGVTRTLKYQLVIGSGVTQGKYENTAWAQYLNGRIISNKDRQTVKVVLDPLFDLGTIIGKVFWDKNETGVQNIVIARSDGDEAIPKSEIAALTSFARNDASSEPGIPDVQIAMEDGAVVNTDKDGKYHFQAVVPGRHLLRINERTLPDGAYLTTDKIIVIDTTPGLLSKVNFGVNSKDKGRKEIEKSKSPVKILQKEQKVKPFLNASLYPSSVTSYASGEFEIQALPYEYEFRIFTNYSLFIKRWKLEILDRATKALVKGFNGTHLTLNELIYWDGKDKDGRWLKPNRNYVYVLSVMDKTGRTDTTKEKDLRVVSYRPEVREASKAEDKRLKTEWLKTESRANNLDSQNIKLSDKVVVVESKGGFEAGESVPKALKSQESLPEPKVEDTSEINIMVDQTSVPVLAGSEAGEDFTQEVIVPEGEHKVTVETVDKEGKKEDRTEYIKDKDNYLLLVAMGDVKAGYTFQDGSIEPVTHDSKFKEGLWSEQKLAYYLKGKILGKYLITSSLDTERDQKALFRNLDPNKYYPVYGDASKVNYDATNTQGILYLLVEWDKSSALWGNYNVNFKDTEFASFSRSLYGANVNYQDVATTQFGEPTTKLVVFKATAKQQAAHNEFVGTGGSLFYLKNKDVVEGSEKVAIEVRDKTTGLVLATLAQEEGLDYEVDYDNGRIMFWESVSHIAESSSIVSSALLNGNPVYVVVDYEWKTLDKYDESVYGARAEQSVTDYVRLGGTYIREDQQDKNYGLAGVDTTLHLGKNTTITGEFARSKSQELGRFISTDGGLTFAQLLTEEATSGKAYGVKGESHIFDKLGVSGYYKKIEKSFSSISTASQQGKQLVGAAVTYDITPKTRLTAKHDIQELLDDGNPQTQLQVGAKKTETTSAQITHAFDDKLKVTGEYRHQKVEDKIEKYQSETNEDGDMVAARADYKLTDKTSLFAEQQASIKGSPNNQTTAGIETKLNEYISLRGKETVGTRGNATSVGAYTNITDRFKLSSDYTLANYKTGDTDKTASVTASAKVDDNSEVYNTYSQTSSSLEGKKNSSVFGAKKTLASGLELTMEQQEANSKKEVSDTNILGASGNLNDKLALTAKFEKGIVQDFDGTRYERNAPSLSLSYADKDKIKASLKTEARFDRGTEDKRQYLVYGALEDKITQDLTLFAKAQVANSANTTKESTLAFYKEFTLGASYRPVNFDRLNLLTRYNYLSNTAPTQQTDIEDVEGYKAHIVAGEAAYDITDHWQVIEKLAIRMAEEKVTGFEFTKTRTWLMVSRLNYNINRDWQVGAEYRRLAQSQAKDAKQGALVEVAKNIGEYVQAGVGYNFTDFNDDLTSLDYTAQGPFIRLTGKLFDRTPEEIERLRQKREEERIKQWTEQLVNYELKNPDSQIAQELRHYYYVAERAKQEGKLQTAKRYYAKVVQTGNMMKQEAEEYVRKRVELEKTLARDDELAKAYYKEGRLEEARQLWEKIIKEGSVDIYPAKW